MSTYLINNHNKHVNLQVHMYLHITQQWLVWLTICNALRSELSILINSYIRRNDVHEKHSIKNTLIGQDLNCYQYASDMRQVSRLEPSENVCTSRETIWKETLEDYFRFLSWWS